MESNGEPGKVHLSEDSMKILENYYPNEFVFTKNKIVELEDFKRKVQTYFIDIPIDDIIEDYKDNE